MNCHSVNKKTICLYCLLGCWSLNGHHIKTSSSYTLRSPLTYCIEADSNAFKPSWNCWKPTRDINMPHVLRLISEVMKPFGGKELLSETIFLWANGQVVTPHCYHQQTQSLSSVYTTGCQVQYKSRASVCMWSIFFYCKTKLMLWKLIQHTSLLALLCMYWK